MVYSRFRGNMHQLRPLTATQTKSIQFPPILPYTVYPQDTQNQAFPDTINRAQNVIRTLLLNRLHAPR